MISEETFNKWFSANTNADNQLKQVIQKKQF